MSLVAQVTTLRTRVGCYSVSVTRGGGGAKRYFSKNRNIYNDRFLVSVGNMFLFPSGIYYSIKDRWERNNTGLKMPLPHLVLLGGTAGVIGSYVSLTLPRFIIRPLPDCL